MGVPPPGAEHSIIFNSVFGSFPNMFTLDLRPDVVHFVTSLLTSYEKSGNESFRCSSVSDLDHKHHYYDHFPVFRLWRNIADEFLHGPPEEDRWKHFWRDFVWCSFHVDELERYILSLVVHSEAYLKYFTKIKNLEILIKVQRTWFQKQLQLTSHSNEDSTYAGFSILGLFKIVIFEAKICFPF